MITTEVQNKVENLKAKSSYGGARPGAGRPKGKKNKETITREAALKQFRDNVARVADRLFMTQFALARGEQFLFHVKWTGKGAKRRKEVVVVDSTEVIKSYLLDELKDGEDNYWFISTKPANNQALDSLLNRTFGTAQQNVDLTTEGKALPAPIYGGLSVRRPGDSQ